MVYCSRNDPTSVSSRPNDGRGATSVANSATIHLEGLMRPIPAYKYLEKCVTIQFDFISWQEDHPNQSCYVTPTWCLLIIGLVEKKYIVQAWNHEGIVLFNEPRGWDRSIASMPRKFQVPPTDAASLPPPGCHYVPNEPSPAPFPSPFIRHQDSLNKEWRVFKVEHPEITKH